MASKETEALSDSESEGDSLPSMKVIPQKSTKRRGVPQRTYSTSEADRVCKEKTASAEVLTEFLSCSPNSNPVTSSGHAHRSLRESKTNTKAISVQGETKLLIMDSKAVCKKKISGALTSPAAFYSPPVRHRPNDLSSAPRPRSSSVPAYSEVQRSMQHLTDEQADTARNVGSRLCAIAMRINSKVPQAVSDDMMLRLYRLAISGSGHHTLLGQQIFHQVHEMVNLHTPRFTHRSILDVLLYGRKMLNQFLTNMDDDDVHGLKMINQFVDLFNIHFLPWIRHHGGWSQVLHHSEDETFGSSSTVISCHESSVDLTVNASHNESTDTSGFVSMDQPSSNEQDSVSRSVTPNVFSSESDEDLHTTCTGPLMSPPQSQSTPVRQLNNIPEVEIPTDTSCPLPTNATTTSALPTNQQDCSSDTTSTGGYVYGGIMVAGATAALIYKHL